MLIDNWEDGKKLTRISATMYVERPGQKAIVIGSKGSALKRIGTMARQDIEADARPADLSRNVREGAGELARKSGIFEPTRLAYDGWRGIPNK